jgi:membrane fusion protein (multidrug efflux system)/multidrug efflux system membrane fusion protein
MFRSCAWFSLGLLGLLLPACRERSDRAEPAPVLEPARVPTPGTAPATPPARPGYIGVVIAGESAEIEPRAEGRIEAVFVAAGDRVARGTPLARLDGKRLRSELSAASAALAEASRRHERRRRLARSNAAAVTTEELDAAQREVVQERARVAQLKDAVAEAVVTAPFEGTVAERYLTAGAMAGPGKAIVRLVGSGEPRVRFALPEDRASEVAPGRLIDVAIAQLGQSVRGKVTGVSPEVDASSRMVYATATLEPRAPGAAKLTTGLITRVYLAEGMAATVEHTPPRDDTPAPPAESIEPAPALGAPAPRPARKRGGPGAGVEKW